MKELWLLWCPKNLLNQDFPLPMTPLFLLLSNPKLKLPLLNSPELFLKKPGLPKKKPSDNGFKNKDLLLTLPTESEWCNTILPLLSLMPEELNWLLFYWIEKKNWFFFFNFWYHCPFFFEGFFLLNTFYFFKKK
jgi:hypothetical protein